MSRQKIDPSNQDDRDTLNALKLVSDQIDSMDDKDPKKEQLKHLFSRQVQQYELPTQSESPDTLLLKGVDYAGGITRTIPNEILLGLKALVDKGRGVPNTWNIEGVKERVGNAINPLARPATTGSEVFEKMGAGEGPHITDIPGVSKFVKPGGRYDLSARGAAGAAYDMMMTPAALEEGFKKLLGREGLKSYEQTMIPGQPPQTANVLESARDLSLLPRPAQGLSAIKQVPGQVFDFMKDTPGAIKDMALKARFSTADKAAALKNKSLPSDIFAEEGGAGITSAGIRQDFRNTIAGHEKRIDEMAGKLPTENDAHTVMRGSPNDVHVADERALQEHYDPLAIDPVTGMPVQPVGNSLLYPLYSAPQRRAEGLSATGAGAQEARKAMEQRIAQAETVNPSFQNQWLHDQAGSGMPSVGQGKAGGQYPLFDEPPVAVTRTRPETSVYTKDHNGVEGVEYATRPSKQVTSFEGGMPSRNTTPRQTAQGILETDRPLSFEEVRDNRRAWQREADLGGLYASGKDKLAPRLPKDIRQVEADAALAGNMAEHASRLENQLLDRAEPGMGGEAYLRKQDVSGLLEGSPWLDRDPISGATQRSEQAFSPLHGRAIGAAKTAANTGMMTTYQALRNPWVRYGALPGARAAWLNNWVERNINGPQRPGAPENPDSPWAPLYREGNQ